MVTVFCTPQLPLQPTGNQGDVILNHGEEPTGLLPFVVAIDRSLLNEATELALLVAQSWGSHGGAVTRCARVRTMCVWSIDGF